jgi:hypothetical protein
MKVTTDTFTGKPFRWNSVCWVELKDGRAGYVPQRCTTRGCEWLHPDRVPEKLYAKLNRYIAHRG